MIKTLVSRLVEMLKDTLQKLTSNKTFIKSLAESKEICTRKTEISYGGQQI